MDNRGIRVDLRTEVSMESLYVVRFPDYNITHMIPNKVAGQALSWTVFASPKDGPTYWMMVVTVDRYGMSLDDSHMLVSYREEVPL